MFTDIVLSGGAKPTHRGYWLRGCHFLPTKKIFYSSWQVEDSPHLRRFTGEHKLSTPFTVSMDGRVCPCLNVKRLGVFSQSAHVRKGTLVCTPYPLHLNARLGQDRGCYMTHFFQGGSECIFLKELALML